MTKSTGRYAGYAVERFNTREGLPIPADAAKRGNVADQGHGL